MTNDSQNARIGVLFVCLGNICRSPLAKWLFVHHATERGVVDRFDIDSCGTGAWHVGNDADPRTIAIASVRGVRLPHEARQLDAVSDLRRFRYILPMDRSNARNIVHAAETAGVSAPALTLMRAYDPTLAGADERSLDVPDPYYGGPDGFEQMEAMLRRATAGLLDHILRNERPS
ncbi:MAG: low molecular weight protein-tyrosine-phosphatase [Planctomycetota bacterium]|nr:low molecular weight protein-tyrosine-phosphatase [Planctomycetota bacterium]